MTASDRTEQVVRAWFTESVEPPRVPDYLPDLIALTASTRQRPAWTLVGTWAPITALARITAGLRPVPWRAMALLGLLLLLLAASVAFYVGRSAPLPAPFGRAENGFVAYTQGGDIFTADPQTGQARAITSGPATDADPVFSRDGTRVAYRRVEDGVIVVAGVDGSNATVVQTPPLFGRPAYEFSPDGRSLLVIPDSGTAPPWLAIADLNGGPPAVLEPEIAVEVATWMPPTGELILASGGRPDEPAGMFLLDRQGKLVRELVAPQQGVHVTLPSPSPDGSRIVFSVLEDPVDFNAELRLFSFVDGVVEPSPPDRVVWQLGYDWSNDGTSIVVGRGYTKGYEGSVLAVLAADALSSRGVETPIATPLHLECCPATEWAPDDSAILVTSVADNAVHDRQVLVDPATGAVRPVPWNTTSPATWQRRAP